MPGGDNLQRAIFAEIQCTFRRADGQNRAGGHQHQAERVLWDDRARTQTTGPIFRVHESSAYVRDNILGPAPAGAHLPCREIGDRGCQLHSEGVGRDAGIRVHQPDQEGQVPDHGRNRWTCANQGCRQ